MKRVLIILGILGVIIVGSIIAGLSRIYIEARAVPDGPGSLQFQRATEKLGSNKKEAAYGNTAKAVELADRMRSIMEEMRKTYFEDPSAYKIETYCQLNKESCAFLIYMPGIFRYDEKSKQKLAEMAWISAQPVLRHIPRSNRPLKLAIGFRGGIPYDLIWTGLITENPLQGADHKYTGLNCRVKLFPFFIDEE